MPTSGHRMRSGCVSLALEGLPAALDELPAARLPLASRVISVGGLSSLKPLNDACRTTSSCVQSLNSTSPTSRGSAQTTPLSAPAGSGFANVGFLALIASSSFHNADAAAVDQPVPTRPA